MKITDVDEYRRKMNERAQPFIGHEGVGSKIYVKKTDDGLVLKESFLGQLMIVLGLFLFGPLLSAVMIARRNDPEFLTTPRPILAFLGFFSLIGWIFGAKYLFRMVAGRRIEVSRNKRAVYLYAGGRKPEKEVSREEIDGIDIFSTWYDTDSKSVENFTVRLKCRDGGTIDLCTCDSRKDVESVKSLIESTIS